MAALLTVPSFSSSALSARTPLRHSSPAVRAPPPFSCHYCRSRRASERRRLTVKAAETDANEVLLGLERKNSFIYDVTVQQSKLWHPRRRRQVVGRASISFLASRVRLENRKRTLYKVLHSFFDYLIVLQSYFHSHGIVRMTTFGNKWKIRLQLTKPVTWPPLVWGVVCGAAASGNFHWNIEDVAKAIVCMIMSGPCLTGYTQTLNDWYDREIDAINEPYRPIPSGAISEGEFDAQFDWIKYFVAGCFETILKTLSPPTKKKFLAPQLVITQIWVLLLAGLGLAGLLDVWVGLLEQGTNLLTYFFWLWVDLFSLTYIQRLLLKYRHFISTVLLKQNGWIGNFALGASYICLPWWAGQALFGTLTPDIIVLTLLYSIAGLGIAIVNDFKSIEGDRALGLQSLPVAFGMDTAKWICVGAIDITQFSVAAYLLGADKTFYALALLGLILPQIYFQFQYFLKDPVKYDVEYQTSAQPFLILGLLVTALATSH
ncbi:hypothetical protein ZIOFF_013487 [Zingiber officinale]|uniref:Chlorophyll synthase n=1 Tax=Zingiber officinale TaxID=94328 RepID=A0A8J5LKX1_ZINOF|nr:hypothetical protein ZIOFF_013487 [Zingiber officinale]